MGYNPYDTEYFAQMAKVTMEINRLLADFDSLVSDEVPTEDLPPIQHS